MRRIAFILFYFALIFKASSQVRWTLVDSLYQPLPSGVHVYRTNDPIEGKPNIAYYVSAKLKDRSLAFLADTTSKRRLTPSGFYQKNQEPLLVVNTSFFSFTTHQNLNLVINEGQTLAYHVHAIAGKGADTLTWRHPVGSALGIYKNRRADVAWQFTDSSARYPLAFQQPVKPFKDSVATHARKSFFAAMATQQGAAQTRPLPAAWKVQIAVGGGPVLVQNGQIRIANNEELKFAGKAIADKHPRTAMGYTANGELIVLVAEGRFPGRAEGLTLTQTAQLLQEIGCIEALNLDGGGSSCMLINGKETIKPSDKEGQRAVPGVFIIKALR
ncbi:MAG: phosphodiester glycosidase family protein [Sphingomonadales bacterium]|nr:phosphodiester glycosidase family protein [Sphingomonadales bacterium]